MYLYFNKNGTLTTQINHGEVPRQGANLSVSALVDLDFFEENGDYDETNWHAYIKVVDSKGDNVLVSTLMNGPEAIVFTKANNAEVTFNLVNGKNYYAFDFLINSSMYPAVTALSGNIKIGITFANEDSSKDVVCGEATVYIEPVLNASYLRNTINPSQYRQIMSRLEHISNSSACNNYSTSYNLVVNRNGYQFAGYMFDDVEITEYSDYTVKQFKKISDGTVEKDLNVIKNYLYTITGNKDVTQFALTHPKDQFVICSQNNTVWKLQYDADNGLLAFRVENIPLIPTKTSDLTNDSGFLTENDLSGYVTETSLGNTLEGYVDNSTFDNTLENYYPTSNPSGYQTASQVTSTINNSLTNVYKFRGSIDVSTLNYFTSTADRSGYKGYVYNITDSGDLNNSTGTTSVVAGDNVAFVYNDANNWFWDKLAGTMISRLYSHSLAANDGEHIYTLLFTSFSSVPFTTSNISSFNNSTVVRYLDYYTNYGSPTSGNKIVYQASYTPFNSHLEVKYFNGTSMTSASFSATGTITDTVTEL